MDRRSFLETLGLSLCGSGLAQAFQSMPRSILLRSSWQTVNIGDIGHTPGVLALLERYRPDIELRLWPSNVDNGVREMLLRRFPKLKLVTTKDEIRTAIEECQFLLHGSGPSLVAFKDVLRWQTETGKPFGVFGITLPSAEEPILNLLEKAQFVFFRDSVSLNLAISKGCQCKTMEFGPDGAFAVDLRNDDVAELFLKENELREGEFMCCIPRLRYTPYWKIKNQPFDEKKHARNEEMQEHDHQPLRQAIQSVIEKTDMKVLLCPEDRSQMSIAKELLYDRLAPDVQRRVVWREKYWLTDEALSTYVRSAGLFGLEMHSPIMCVGNKIPAIVGRFSEQTSKGLMWRDIGLQEWLFDFDDPNDRGRYADAVLNIATHPAEAKKQAALAQAYVQNRHREMVSKIGA